MVVLDFVACASAGEISVRLSTVCRPPHSAVETAASYFTSTAILLTSVQDDVALTSTI